jgi:dephospho-CoA kinase
VRQAPVVILCGPTGSGKSTLGSILGGWGAARIDADAVAREVVEPGSPVLAALQARFGEDIVDTDGALRRDVLAKRAFASEEQTRALEALTHPVIRERLAEQVVAARRSGAPLVVVEVPLWRRGDGGLAGDLVVWVGASDEVAAARVAAHGRLSASEVLRRRSRFDFESQREEADLVLVNDGSIEALGRAARELWEQLVGVEPDGKGSLGP